MVKQLGTGVVLALILTLGFQVSFAYAHSSEIFDAAGDIPLGAPGYYDIVHAKVTDQVGKGTLFFSIELGAAVPDTPTDALGRPRFVAWNWLVDTSGDGISDYNIIVRYCSHTIQAPCVGDAWHWESALFRPPSPQAINAFPFRVDGATIKAYLDPAQLGGPTQFGWITLTRISPGVSGAPPTDIAPDSGVATFVR
jgi:hypothetical protein